MSGNVKFDKWINDDNSENYKCRAWVNFNGEGTVAIRASRNVSSITDTGTGNYTINFSNAMPDSNYVVCANGSPKFAVADFTSIAINTVGGALERVPTTTSFAIVSRAGSAVDLKYISVAVFR